MTIDTTDYATQRYFETVKGFPTYHATVSHVRPHPEPYRMSTFELYSEVIVPHNTSTDHTVITNTLTRTFWPHDIFLSANIPDVIIKCRVIASNASGPRFWFRGNIMLDWLRNDFYRLSETQSLKLRLYHIGGLSVTVRVSSTWLEYDEPWY